MNTVTEHIVGTTEALLQVAGTVVAMALVLLVTAWGSKWLMRTFKSFAKEEPWTAEDREEYERVGREVDLGNNMRGMAPGWGAFHGQRGSGLQRGRRSR